MIIHKITDRTFTIVFTPGEIRFLQNIDVCENDIRTMSLELFQSTIMYKILLILGGDVAGVGQLPENEINGN